MGLLTGKSGRQRVPQGQESMPGLDPGSGYMAVTNRRFQDLMDGHNFIYHMASQAILLSATTGGHPTVFNPLGSGVVFIPNTLSIAFISGTTVIGSVLIAETINAGSSQATAGAILTLTKVDAKNALRGGGLASRVFWSPTTNTFTAAPTVIGSCINLAPADPVSGFVAHYDFNDCYAFMPGTAMSITYSVTTSTAVFQITLTGTERPLAP